MKERGFGSIQIFGERTVQHPSAEADHPALAIMDGNNQAIAKGIVKGVSFQVMLDQVGPVQRVGRIASLHQMVAQRIPTVRRKTKLELCRHLGINASSLQIVARRLGLLAAVKLIPEKERRSFVQFVYKISRPRIVLIGLFGQLHTGLLGQKLQSLPEVHILLLHQKREYVAACAACAETPPRAGVGKDDEAGCAFLMEGATGFERAAGALQGHITGNEVYGIDPSFDFVRYAHLQLLKVSGQRSGNPGSNYSCARFQCQRRGIRSMAAWSSRRLPCAGWECLATVSQDGGSSASLCAPSDAPPFLFICA